MPERETPVISPAERRRKKAEEKGEASISHWKGELHAHTATKLTKPELPEQEIEARKGSNCGQVPLEVLIRYHSQEMLDDFIAITEHSRDADPQKALRGVTDWFRNMYLNNEAWLKTNFNKTKNELSQEDHSAIERQAATNAGKLIFYGDERLEEILSDIEKLQTREGLPIKIIKGVEANLKPDGSFDTPMIEEGKFELVNCSIHPEIDEKLEEIVKDPERYTDLVVAGIRNSRTNIMCHIGYGAEKGFAEKLDWDKIASAALENNVAIEINLKELMDFIYKEIMNYKKYPKDDVTYRQIFKEKLPELVPLLSSPQIREKLKPYFEKGLKIALNTDEHAVKFIGKKVERVPETGELLVTSEFKPRDLRFWRCIKMVEKYFNDISQDANIKLENIVNTYSPEQLEQFIKKA